MEPTYSPILELSDRVRRQPYQSLLIAAGIGYIIGGGLFTRLTMNAVRMGMRMSMLPMIQQELMGAAEAYMRPQPQPNTSS